MRDLSQIQAQYVKGVGPGRAGLLRRLGIRSVIDLLRHYPRRYDDRRQIRRISQLEAGRNETVRGKVLAVGTKRLRKALTIVQVALGDGSGTVYATWFNQLYMQSRFKVGQELILTGKVQRRGCLEILSPEFEILSAQESALLNAGRIVPVYPLSEHLSQRAMRKIIHACIEGYAASMPELLEASLREECGLCPVSEALRNIHFPDSPAALEAARRRLVFDEFLPMQLAVHLKRKQLAELPGSSKKGGELVRRFLNSLPFELTRAQERVIAEVSADMGRAHPMNRLLQGDVGSGKTIVAIVALLIALDAHYQGVLMAPTEILAEQHWRTLDALLSPLGIRPYLLTGEMGAAEKAGVYEAIRSSSPSILVGTHAVLQGDVEFSRLGIVVVDEQHRFGVSQRAAIRSKGENPDFMVMTATPIPRTLALTLYGDLDVSVIDEMPPGRGTVVTRWVPPEKMGEAYAFVRAEALKGHQAYIIYPLVEESEKLPLNAARNMAASLSGEQFRDLRVGLIHGRMGREEREEVMRDFRAGLIGVLVATSVIEVGLDVPGASLMLVEHAERFGLSQLHQMRGRIGRGKKRSYFLFSGQPATEEGIKRLKALCATNDGFRIAEMDLELRGPGEFFSDRQHGGPDLRLADPFKDEELLKLSREIAARIAGADRRLKSESHRSLRELLIKKYSGKFFLGVTG